MGQRRHGKSMVKEKNSKSPKLLTYKERVIFEELIGYIESCRALPKGKNVPNICGFCRFLGIGRGELLETLTDCPSLADRLLTVLEDEAISADASSALLSQYLRLIDETRRELRPKDSPSSPMTVIFSHGDGE